LLLCRQQPGTLGRTDRPPSAYCVEKPDWEKPPPWPERRSNWAVDATENAPKKLVPDFFNSIGQKRSFQFGPVGKRFVFGFNLASSSAASHYNIKAQGALCRRLRKQFASPLGTCQ
jgi:hypothetical protein